MSLLMFGIIYPSEYNAVPYSKPSTFILLIDPLQHKENLDSCSLVARASITWPIRWISYSSRIVTSFKVSLVNHLAWILGLTSSRDRVAESYQIIKEPCAWLTSFSGKRHSFLSSCLSLLVNLTKKNLNAVEWRKRIHCVPDP